LSTRVTAYREKEAALAEAFSPRVLAIEDLGDVVARFAHQHRGFRKLLGAYRRDKRVVAMASRTGRASKDVIKRLPEAAEWKGLRNDLRRAEQRWAESLGEQYYSGTETDFAELTAALYNADTLLTAKPSCVRAETLAAHFSAQGRPDSNVKAAADTVAEMVKELGKRLPPSEIDESWRSLRLHDLMQWLERALSSINGILEIIDSIDETTGQSVTLETAQQGLDLLDDLFRVEDSFEATLPNDIKLLGPGYDAWRSDWLSITAGVDWAGELLRTAPEPISESVVELIHDGVLDPQPLAGSLETWLQHHQRIASLFECPQREHVSDIMGGAFDEIETLLADLVERIDDIDEWVTFREVRSRLASYGLDSLIEFCADERLPSADLVGAVERSVLQGWVEAAIKADGRVKKLRRTQREALVEEFRQIDRELGRHAAAEIIHVANDRRPTRALGGAGLIRTEGLKKKRHRPIRTLMGEARDVIQALKPCFMMSPLSVSQFIDPATRFDMVIFDEASQVQPADAINCIYRGRQVIVAGDQKQLPPTSFFMRMSGDDEDEWSEEQFDEFESVLDVAKAGGLEALPLRWHYRSLHEGLITFSNYSFYDGKLVTYPGPYEALDSLGVQFFHVEGVYRRAGSRDNPVEAEKVADRVLHHARSHPSRTLGVVAFSEAQAGLIERVIVRRRAEHPDLDVFFEGDRLSGFFVKNLENVQGDERDTMIFSLGYGPDEFGKFTLNLGPLNRPGGERRLNVAITRARQRVEVVSSVLASDFGAGALSKGVRLLASYLDYAERGVAALAHTIGPSGLDAESPFEEEVVRVIRSWGYGAEPQVGAAGYRVDIGVKESDGGGRFILGVECDGAQYHSSRVARDRDRLRQGVLERLGWRVYRIWGPAWYRTRDAEERKLHEAIEAAIDAGGSGRAPRSSAAATSPPQVTIREIPLNERPTWAKEYVAAEARIRNGIDLGAPESLPAVIGAVAEIVEVESPISFEIALGRLKEAGGVARAGRRIREVFETAVSTLKRRGTIRIDRRRFLWRSSGREVSVRIPLDDEPATIRKVSDVPPEEIRLAVLGLLTDAITAERDELTASTARLFGWSRRGADIGRALDQAVTLLIRENLVTRDGQLLRITKQDRGA
jgi:very-short-patch-repair endonuclease